MQSRLSPRRAAARGQVPAAVLELFEVRLPAIVLTNVRGYSHFVVLEGIQDGYVLLSDPANGMRSLPLGEFEGQWTGIFFLILTNAEQAQQGFNSEEKWASAPAPPHA
jgi:predicted double-glycine peptidase